MNKIQTQQNNSYTAESTHKTYFHFHKKYKFVIVGLVGLFLLLGSTLLFISELKKPDKSREDYLVDTLLTPSPRILSDEEAFKLNSLEEITFIPRKIKNYSFSPTIKQEAERRYPGFTDEDLKKLLAKRMLTWTALRDFYSDKNLSTFHLKPIDKEINFDQVEEELSTMEDHYRKNQLMISGFYLKIRFAGVFPENLSKLSKSEADLRMRAGDLIRQYIAEAETLLDPANILTKVSNNDEVKLLNNEEKSATFKDYSLYPPFFDDPDFYIMITSPPINKFTPIYTLKTKNPQKEEYEEYAFVSFYITQKKGEYLPIEELRDQFIKKSQIR